MESSYTNLPIASCKKGPTNQPAHLFSNVHPHPPVTRALHHAVAKLKAAGVRVVDFRPPGFAESAADALKLITSDGLVIQRGLLAKGGEPLESVVKWTLDMFEQKPLDLSEIWEMIVKRDAARDE